MSETKIPSLDDATIAATALGVPPTIAAKGTQFATEAGSQPTRYYHTVAHFADLLAGSHTIAATLTGRGIDRPTAQTMANLYAIAARDHDTVYIGADGGRITPPIEAGIRPYVTPTQTGEYRIIDTHAMGKLASIQQQNLEIAMDVFGFKAGEKLNKFAGQNEFLSALHSLEINPNLTPDAKIGLVAIHQATIPFVAPDATQQLATRIETIKVDDAPALTRNEVHAIALTAADFANRDVASFAGNAIDFQNGTYALLQEMGADFTRPTSIIESANRQATFFKGLQAALHDGSKTVFQNYSFNNESGHTVSLLAPNEHTRLNAAADVQISNSLHMLNSMTHAATDSLSKGKHVLPNPNTIRRLTAHYMGHLVPIPASPPTVGRGSR